MGIFCIVLWIKETLMIATVVYVPFLVLENLCVCVCVCSVCSHIDTGACRSKFFYKIFLNFIQIYYF